LRKRTVSGVVSIYRLPLPGKECISETNWNMTDFDGKFYIKAATNQVLIFSYIGMNTKELKKAGIADECQTRRFRDES
jgi:Ca-activated chloride channel family protein